MSEAPQQNLPALRFPEFEGEWEEKTGHDVFKNSRAKGEDRLPIYSVTMDRGLIRRDSLDRNMGADAASEENLRAQKDDLVYNMMRMWQGAVGKASEECMVSPAYVVLSPGPETCSDFFCQWFKSAKGLYKLWAYSHGLTSDRLRLYYKDFAQIHLTIPHFPEQKKIAAFLAAVDEKFEKLQGKRELLTDYKRGVMQQIFSRRIRFKADGVSDFPDWEKKKLKYVAHRQIEKNTENKILCVLTNSAVRGIISQQDYFDKDIANKDNLLDYYIVRKGDFVYNPRISASAPVGPIKKSRFEVGVMSPLYTVFRFDLEETDFFEQYFQTAFWHRYMCSVANYGVRHDRMNITVEEFLGIPVPYPHPDEQQKIANFLAAIDVRISAVSGQISQLKAFKKGLLQQMFV